MTRTSLALGIATIVSGAAVISGCPGCGPDRPDHPATPERVYDVGPLALARDLPTARSYAGRLVRVRLAPGSYETAGTELRIRGTVPFSPPLVVFRCRDAVPGAGGELVVTGRCGPPERDGFFRTTSADFCVTVADCSVSRSP